MKTRVFNDVTWVDAPVEKVFDFFSQAGNLEDITPPFLQFRIIPPVPEKMEENVIINYRLKLHKFPVKWTTKITQWDPPYHFQDIQLKGPYRKWIHTHTFESKDGGTLITDRVEYSVPGWFLESIIHRFFVYRDLKAIFAFRGQEISKYFAIGQTN